MTQHFKKKTSLHFLMLKISGCCATDADILSKDGTGEGLIVVFIEIHCSWLCSSILELEL